jgi:hypothetical protein
MAFTFVVVFLYFFLLAIVLFVLLQYTDSDYPFGIFKLFLYAFLGLVPIILIRVGAQLLTQKQLKQGYVESR